MIFSFNESDWTSGWSHLLKGKILAWNWFEICLNFRRYNVYNAKLWNITWPWWCNSTKSKWDSIGHFSKKNYLSPWSTIWPMSKTFSIWFNAFQRFVSSSGLKCISYTLKNRLYKEAMHVPMFDRSSRSSLQVLVSIIPTKSQPD